MKLSAELLLQSSQSKKRNPLAYRNLAAMRFPGAAIDGSGRYALQDEAGIVHLYETRDEAAKWTSFYDSQIIHLYDIDAVLDSMPERTSAKRR